MNEEEYIFDNYFEDMNLNQELKSFYEFINDDELTENLIDKIQLTDLRNENYKRYIKINLLDLQNLPEKYKDIVEEINKIYNYIKLENLIVDTREEALGNKKIIDSVYSHINKLNELLKKELIELEKINDNRQNELKQIDYNKIDKNVLSDFLAKYNNLILFNATIEEDFYKNYKRQIKRKKYLNELYRIINLEIEDKTATNLLLNEMNNKINFEIQNIYNKICYLEDLIMEKSPYQTELIVFKTYIASVIAYDDSDYSDVSRVYNLLCNDLKIKSLIEYFETNFIKEIENTKKEENFIYKKYGIKNIKSSLDYISANYIDIISEDDKKIINILYKKITEEYDLNEIYTMLKKLINKIWKHSLTDIYSYNETEKFCFICTNNQFLDEKHESILITREMLNRVNDYSDYQIGFICDFTDNILYITENEDIMSVKHDDMSDLKSPKQIEQEFMNFRVCNRIALNGYITKIKAVYFINDGNMTKYKKAVELANQYFLPLIVLKKDN